MEEAEAEAVEEEEEEEEVEEEVLLKPDQFDLAKLFAGPNDLKNVSILYYLNFILSHQMEKD